MSIATVVTRGYGSFGTVNDLPTLGYSIGATLIGGTVCGTADIAPRVEGAAAFAARTTGTASFAPRVEGTAALEDC